MDNKYPPNSHQPGAAYAPNFPPPNTNVQGYAQPPYVCRGSYFFISETQCVDQLNFVFVY